MADEEVEEIREDDELKAPFERLQNAQLDVELAKIEILAILEGQGITSFELLWQHKKYIYGIIEATLPNRSPTYFREKNDKYRSFKSMTSQVIKSLPITDQVEFDSLKANRRPVQNQIRKVFASLKLMFNPVDSSGETPKKASGKKASNKKPTPALLPNVAPPPTVIPDMIDGKPITEEQREMYSKIGQKVPGKVLDNELIDGVNKTNDTLAKRLSYGNEDEDVGDLGMGGLKIEEEEDEEGKEYEELDEETGRIVRGEAIGKVGGDYDRRDEEEDRRICEGEDRAEQKAIKTFESPSPSFKYLGQRSSSGGGVKAQQDLYETPAFATQAIIDTLIVNIPNYKELTYWEICAGNNAILNVMVENGMNCIGTDKYTYEVSTDYLTCEDIPEIDFIITNPPFCVSTKILEKLYARGKPFLILLPVVNISRIKKFKIFNTYGVIMYNIFPTPSFLHEGKEKMVEVCCWYYYNPDVCSAGSIVVKECRVNKEKAVVETKLE